MEIIAQLAPWIVRLDISILVAVVAVLIVRKALDVAHRHRSLDIPPLVQVAIAPVAIAVVKVIGVVAAISLPAAIVVREREEGVRRQIDRNTIAYEERINRDLARAAITPRHEAFRGPIWNLWAERFSASTHATSAQPTFIPTLLEPNTEYSLVLNLAGLRFSDERRFSLFSKEASSTFSEWLDRNRHISVAELTVIALVDTDYFGIDGENVKTLRVDLDKVRQAERDGFEVFGSPFESLRAAAGDTPFSFGLQSFHFKTSTRTGSASIAISVWSDGKPVDELTLTLCIVAAADSTACEGKLSASNPLAGVDLTMRGIYPDLALHLLDRKSGVVGVLRCNSCGWQENDYRGWELFNTAEWVSGRLNEITTLVSTVPQSSTSDQVQRAMVSAGKDIYNVIFHARNPDNDASRAFADFMASTYDRQNEGKPPPSLFVRIIPDRPNLMLAPIGLMYAGSPNTPSQFVGFRADVQTPLEYQEYSSSSACISRWVLFVPPETQRPTLPKNALEEVLAARYPFRDWIATFKQSCGTCVIDNEDDFQEWLSQSGPGESDAVVILSHHNANGLYFDSLNESPRILSSAVQRRFLSPSFVILGACGTSEPGSSEFIRQFNFRGVTSAVATSTKVEPVLAGKFLATFMTLLQEHSNDANYTVNQARFDAVKALGQDPDYGPKALAFILAGNGALRLCVPQ